MNKNPESFLTVNEINGDIRPPYRHTFNFESDFINEHHQFYSECKKDTSNTIIDIGIKGWLMPQDALKLYELAYFCKDDMLELGTYQGLSTSINAMAFNDSKNQNRITTLDIDKVSSGLARKNLEPLLGSNKVDYVVSDATSFLDKLIEEEKKFEFSFIDHSHKYEDVYSTCIRLNKIMKPGSFCLFHDYNDKRNFESGEEKYGVYQAIHTWLPSSDFEFYGIFGCTALLRRKI